MKIKKELSKMKKSTFKLYPTTKTNDPFAKYLQSLNHLREAIEKRETHASNTEKLPLDNSKFYLYKTLATLYEIESLSSKKDHSFSNPIDRYFYEHMNDILNIILEQQGKFKKWQGSLGAYHLKNFPFKSISLLADSPAPPWISYKKAKINQ